jgi:hypothetical protein
MDRKGVTQVSNKDHGRRTINLLRPKMNSSVCDTAVLVLDAPCGTASVRLVIPNTERGVCNHRKILRHQDAWRLLCCCMTPSFACQLTRCLCVPRCCRC